MWDMVVGVIFEIGLVLRIIFQIDFIITQDVEGLLQSARCLFSHVVN